ncbi:MAG: hypothetical protein CVU38_10315 [Chloroflexi bacterium HGW-Chloroflexi-1]|nr:MAG: hypothetical protein CVU38_10315 [Chloroflexi bacterium HGW-Chloroflexi-1]
MADRVDQLFQEWQQLGGCVLLAESQPVLSVRSPEEVIAESTAYCRESGRLTWIVLDWLIRNVGRVDVRRLLRLTRQYGDLSVLGVLCDAAQQRQPHPKFTRLMRSCQPAKKIEPFFHRVAKNRLALELTQEGALDIFRRWGYLSNELRYL